MPCIAFAYMPKSVIALNLSPASEQVTYAQYSLHMHTEEWTDYKRIATIFFICIDSKKW